MTPEQESMIRRLYFYSYRDQEVSGIPIYPDKQLIPEFSEYDRSFLASCGVTS